MFSSAVILCQICGAKISRKVENCWGGGGGGGGGGTHQSVVRGGPTSNPYLLIRQF